MADTPQKTTETIEVKRRGFNLDTFEKESLTGKIEFEPLPKEGFIESALARVNGDTSKFYELVNNSVRRDAVLTMRNELNPPETSPNWIPSAKVVLNFVNNFREMAPYKSESDRKKQTTMIVAFLKSQPAMMDALKVLALATVGTEEEEEES